jgi:hypothetical protein
MEMDMNLREAQAAIWEELSKHHETMIQFLRELIAIPNYSRPARTGKWVFSTNATYWMGKAGIPAIGFGPGEEKWAHSPLDQVPAAEMVQCADFYAMLPLFLSSSIGDV